MLLHSFRLLSICFLFLGVCFASDTLEASSVNRPNKPGENNLNREQRAHNKERIASLAKFIDHYQEEVFVAKDEKTKNEILSIVEHLTKAKTKIEELEKNK